MGCVNYVGKAVRSLIDPSKDLFHIINSFYYDHPFELRHCKGYKSFMIGLVVVGLCILLVRYAHYYYCTSNCDEVDFHNCYVYIFSTSLFFHLALCVPLQGQHLFFGVPCRRWSFCGIHQVIE